MTLRFRVLGLVIVVALIAIAATAWITTRIATREVAHTVQAKQQDITLISQTLAAHGRRAGSWNEVPDRVRELAAQTGSRIRVVTESGQVLADSDLLAGRLERPTAGPPSVVDIRPQLQLPADLEPRAAVKLTATSIGQYFYAMRFRECMAAHGQAVKTLAGAYGVEQWTAVNATHPAAKQCVETSTASPDEFDAWLRASEPCLAQPEPTAAECLRKEFTRQVSGSALEPLYIYVGAVDEVAAPLPVGTITIAAAAIAAIAVLGAFLLGRRLLRPITALTAATRGLGEGHLGRRVPVRGRDELTELSRAFNRMADSLQRSEESQRRMIADVAHELRTPLVNLRGYLEGLKDGVIAPSPALFASLHEETLLQQRIVDDLQDLALADAGTLTYHKTLVNLAELAKLPGWVPVHGDPDRLRQVIGNLVSNAVRAGGAVTVSVRAENGAARLSVTDTGTGIAPEHLPHLFDRFWRADSARSRASGGSGLGLAIAKQIVTDHGGTISVVSRIGQGSTFTVSLPMAPG
jgi:signal transduction histidine kinase